MEESFRRRVKFITEPISPELDIQPTNECKIEVREIDTWDEKGKHMYIQRRCMAGVWAPSPWITLQPSNMASDLGYHIQYHDPTPAIL